MLSHGSTQLWWTSGQWWGGLGWGGLGGISEEGVSVAQAALGIDSDHLLQVFPCLSGSSSLQSELFRLVFLLIF